MKFFCCRATELGVRPDASTSCYFDPRCDTAGFSPLATFRGRRGFTLIELILVVAIMAMLSGAAISYFGDSRDTAADAVVKQNLKTTREALGRYFKSEMQYPTSLASLTGAYLQNTYQEMLLMPMGNRVTGLEVEVPSGVGVSPNAYLATVTAWVTYPPSPLLQIRNVRLQGAPYDTW